jgi:hypothetical protein
VKERRKEEVSPEGTDIRRKGGREVKKKGK